MYFSTTLPFYIFALENKSFLLVIFVLQHFQDTDESKKHLVVDKGRKKKRKRTRPNRPKNKNSDGIDKGSPENAKNETKNPQDETKTEEKKTKRRTRRSNLKKVSLYRHPKLSAEESKVVKKVRESPLNYSANKTRLLIIVPPYNNSYGMRLQKLMLNNSKLASQVNNLKANNTRLKEAASDSIKNVIISEFDDSKENSTAGSYPPYDPDKIPYVEVPKDYYSKNVTSQESAKDQEESNNNKSDAETLDKSENMNDEDHDFDFDFEEFTKPFDWEAFFKESEEQEETSSSKFDKDFFEEEAE